MKNIQRSGRAATPNVISAEKCKVLPVLFNTDMVRAILSDRKGVTRRLGSCRITNLEVDETGLVTASVIRENKRCSFISHFESGTLKQFIETFSDYQPGDILYVRETWCLRYDGEKYFYKADKNTPREEKRLIDYDHVSWKPSIHMPKEAARIWLKVKDVRVERLQEMSDEDCEKEGLENFCKKCSPLFSNCDTCLNDGGIKEDFKELWNSTIKKSDLDRYGWDANPWVWVIEFERCEKPENC